jgi:2-haloacid dehalogenase
MRITLAFDVYGTLIDTHGLTEMLQSMVGDKAPAFSQTWRDKQLEYSFRRGLMGLYQDFSVCTRDALSYTCDLYGGRLSDLQRQELLASYRVLPVFEDVREGLNSLSGAGYALYAFSNGGADAIKKLLCAAAIESYFLDVISVEDLRTFKPNPSVYDYFLRRSDSCGSDAWLISSNAFDVIGATAAGMRSVWLQRSETQVFDPWGIEPTLKVSSLTEIEARLAGFLDHGN